MITREQVEALKRGDICYVHGSPGEGESGTIFIYTGKFGSAPEQDRVGHLGGICVFNIWGDGRYQLSPRIVRFDKDPEYSDLGRREPIDDLARRLGRFTIPGDGFSSIASVPVTSDQRLYVGDQIIEFVEETIHPNSFSLVNSYHFLRELLLDETTPLSSDE